MSDGLDALFQCPSCEGVFAMREMCLVIEADGGLCMPCPLCGWKKPRDGEKVVGYHFELGSDGVWSMGKLVERE